MPLAPVLAPVLAQALAPAAREVAPAGAGATGAFGAVEQVRWDAGALEQQEQLSSSRSIFGLASGLDAGLGVERLIHCLWRFTASASAPRTCYHDPSLQGPNRHNSSPLSLSSSSSSSSSSPSSPPPPPRPPPIRRVMPEAAIIVLL